MSSRTGGPELTRDRTRMLGLAAIVVAGVASQWAGVEGLGTVVLETGPFGGLALIGLLGLTMRDDSRESIADLAESTERLAAGADDVELPTARSDEVGRLATAIAALASDDGDTGDRSSDDPEVAGTESTSRGRSKQSSESSPRRAAKADRAAKRRLEERERQLSTLMSNIPGMVYRCRNEPDWPFEFVSEGSSELVGYDPETLVHGDVTWSTDVLVDRQDELWEAVQSALTEREPFQVTYPIETAGGERRWMKEQGRGVFDDDGSLEALEGVIIDVTDRVESERELERTRQLLSQAQRLANVGAWELDVRNEPYEQEWSDEVSRIFGVSTEEDVDVEDALGFHLPEDRDRLEAAIDRAIEFEASYDLELRLDSVDGEQRWVRTIGEPVTDGGEVVAIRGSIQDVTDRRERERALESLHEAARGLLGAESESAAADLVVETAADVLDVRGVGVYLVDADENAFLPAAATDGFADVCGGTPVVPFGEDDSVLWNAFVSETQTVFEDVSVADRSPLFGSEVPGGLVVPIGDHGLFVFVAEPSSIGDRMRRLAETLVATTEAAFDRLDTEATLRERDAELAARNRRLRRQIAITEIIRSIDRSLVRATSRSEVERTVCERLIDTDDIAFAWIGSVDASESAVEPRVWAGDGEAYLDAVSLGTDADPLEPAVRTARTGRSTVVSNLVDDLQSVPWRKTALANDFASCLCVPIALDEYAYGVLAVYGTETDGFGDLERTVFEELGENIANTISAVQTREALHADALLELTLEFEESDAFFARVARETGATITYQGVAAHSSDETRLFFTTDGAPPAPVEDVLEGLLTVRDWRLVSPAADDRDEDATNRCLFEATITGTELVSRLLRHGASPRSITATPSELTVVVDVSRTTDVRSFVEMIARAYPSVELVGRRDVDGTMHTRGELVSSLFEPLTDRQLEVLRTAYFAGFFEWPRTSTGEDVATMLDVSQPTVNRHVRIGQQRLFDQLFGSEGHTVVGDRDDA